MVQSRNHRPKMVKLSTKAKTYILQGFSDYLAGFYSYLVGVFHWAVIGDRYKVLGDSYKVLGDRSTLEITQKFLNKVTSCDSWGALRYRQKSEIVAI